MGVVVFGAGSLGSLLGGLLDDVSSVTLVGRDPHVETVRNDGLRITGAINRTVYPEAQTTVPDTADAALVTVKSYDTDCAARQLKDCDCNGVLSLQNGLGNEEVLDEFLPCEVLAGTCTYGARLLEPGVVECTGIGAVELGALDDSEPNLVTYFGDLFIEAGIDTKAVTDMSRRLWRKLAINAGINPTSALARVPNGALVEGPACETARRAAREVAQVANENRITLDPVEVVEAMQDVAEQTATNRSSMLQDVEIGRRTEIDAINGAVVERANGPVPVNQTLAELIRAWESEQSIR